jgi:UDP-glucuronate 4-epimerase|tara:strand:+ start:238 stop:1188 length:951 start_codon:yes stop_codon:yes gene_type:complete
MKYYITGINGFIGFTLAKKLAELGHEVTGIDNMNHYYDVSLKIARNRILVKEHGIRSNYGSLLSNGDLNHTLSKEKPDVVIHLAAYAGIRNSIENPNQYINNNVTGTQNLINACEKYGIENVLYASTSSVMADNKIWPWNEQERLGEMLSPYAYTKQSNEHQFKISKIKNTMGLRFFTVYGPWGRPDMALFTFANKIVAGEPIDVYNYGNMKRDFTYVDDIVQGIFGLLDQIPEGDEIFNIGYGKQVGLMEFITEIEKNLGRTAEKNMLPMHPADSKETWSDTSKLYNLTGYNPKTSVVDGVKEFIDWYKSYYKIN